MSKAMQGVVHGRTIKLDEDPGIEEGRKVEVLIRIRRREVVGRGIRAIFDDLVGKEKFCEVEGDLDYDREIYLVKELQGEQSLYSRGSWGYYAQRDDDLGTLNEPYQDSYCIYLQQDENLGPESGWGAMSSYIRIRAYVANGESNFELIVSDGGPEDDDASFYDLHGEIFDLRLVWEKERDTEGHNLRVAVFYLLVPDWVANELRDDGHQNSFDLRFSPRDDMEVDYSEIEQRIRIVSESEVSSHKNRKKYNGVFDWRKI